MASRYRALLIGNSTYPADEHNLQTLKGLVKDIAVLNRALADPAAGLFDDADVTLLPEATSSRAIRAMGAFFGAAARDDVLLIYFSGHGKLDQSGRLQLCMQDTESTDLLSTAVSSTRINEFADASHARNVIIVLDCCHAGAFRGGELGDAVAGPGRYVMTSCRGTQLANDATVVIHDSFQSNDPGCSVTLTDAQSGRTILPVEGAYETVTYQIHQAGSFRWQVSAPKCLVTPQAGPGNATLPLYWQYVGDTDGFAAPAQVSVHVEDYEGSPNCPITLSDPASGQQIDAKTATPGQNNDTVTLDPGGRKTVYLSDLGCKVRVTAATPGAAS